MPTKSIINTVSASIRTTPKHQWSGLCRGVTFVQRICITLLPKVGSVSSGKALNRGVFNEWDHCNGYTMHLMPSSRSLSVFTSTFPYKRKITYVLDMIRFTSCLPRRWWSIYICHGIQRTLLVSGDTWELTSLVWSHRSCSTGLISIVGRVNLK